MYCNWLVCRSDRSTSVKYYDEILLAVLEYPQYSREFRPSAEKKYWEGWHFDKGRKFMYNCRNCLQFPSYNFNEPGIHRLLKQGNNRLCGFGHYFWTKQCLFILWLLFYFHFIHFNKCFKKSGVFKQGSREGEGGEKTLIIIV